MHATCRLGVTLMFCIKISATKHAQLYKHHWGDFHLEVYSCLQPSSAQHLKTLEILGKLNFRRGTLKYQLYLSVVTHRPRGGHLCHLLLPMVYLLLGKTQRKAVFSTKGTAEQGVLGWHRLTLWPLRELCCAYLSSTHRSGKGGRGGDRGQSQLRAESSAAPPTLHRLAAMGEAGRLSGQMVTGYGLGVTVKLVPVTLWMFPEELFSAKHSPGVTAAHTFAHTDAVAWLIQQQFWE